VYVESVGLGWNGRAGGFASEARCASLGEEAELSRLPAVMAKDVTTLLLDWGRGDPAALSALMPLVYARLRRQAGAALRGRPEGTLQATELVHETFLELLDQRQVRLEDRQRFFGLAAFLMRRILVARERRRRRIKREGARVRTTLDPELPGHEGPSVDLLALHAALERLERAAPRQARLVEARVFGGYGLEECAAILGISLATANRDWRLARAWLQAELAAPGAVPLDEDGR
jgi:RNA polymerase sigma-70 factor, ECF subfamily